MTITKRALSLFIAIVLLLTAIPVTASAAVIGDDYPSNLKSAAVDALVDPWNFYNRECTSFAAWRLNSQNGVAFTNYYGGVHWGHAKNWAAAAKSAGITVNSTPAIGSIACSTSGTYGHVAWVADVNGSNVTIEEYNYGTNGAYKNRTVASSTFPYYIHIKDLTATLPPASITSGTYILEPAVSSEMCLGLANGYSPTWGNAVLRWDTNAETQAFVITGDGLGYYSIVNKATGLYLDVAGAGKTNGTSAQLIKPNGNNAQWWRFEDAGNGYYCIVSKCNGLSLDVKGGTAADGTQVPLWGGTGTNQKWKLRKYTPTRYSLIFDANGGEGAPTAVSASAGTKYTIPAQKPSRKGYSFLGWSQMPFNTETVFQPGESLTINANTTLYAAWKANTCTVTYHANGGSGAPDASGTLSYGSSYTIPAQLPVRDKFEFAGWAVSPSTKTADYQPGNKLTLSGNVTLYAVWCEAAHQNRFRLSYYYYAGSTKNGYEEKTSFDPVCRFIVRESEETRAGYTFRGWSWSKNSTVAEYRPSNIVEIEEDRILYAVWEPDNPSAFTDVTVGQYYYDAVDWAVQNKITSGTSSTTFSPNDSCTRAQAVTFLWRAAGKPEPATAMTAFDDVPTSSYYEKAVRWAVENGITSGIGHRTFGPNQTCSRGQIATFLYRGAGSPTVSDSNFEDVATDAYYARAVAWAAQHKITTGTGNNRFSPNADCTRGQIVSFLYRSKSSQ